MISTQKIEELEKLLSAIEDEGGTQERYDRLNALLHGDPEACEFYLNYQTLIAALDQTYAAQPVELADEDKPENVALRTTHMIVQSSPRVATTKWNNPWWIGAAASVMVTGMVLGLFALSGGNKDKPTVSPTGEILSEDGVAVLTRTLEADFGTDGPVASDILAKGPIELKSGLAQIEFYNGARALVEGPARIELLDDESIFVASGRVRAQVPPQAQMLRVFTPQAELVGSEGEFGLYVDGLESTEFHHFDGNLDYRAAKGDLVTNTVGEAIFVSNDGIAEYLEEADAKKFIGWVDILESSRAAATRRYRDWRISTSELMSDPRVRVYYTFDDQNPGDRMLTNHAGTSSHEDGAIVGSRWIQGRWRDKRALAFNKASDRVRFAIEGSPKAVTLVSWVRFDRASGKPQTLLSPDKTADGIPEWRVDEKGRLQLRVPTNGGKAFESVLSKTPVLTRKNQGRWHHVATVIDSESRKVTHLVNGKPISTSMLRSKPNLQFGRVQLGNVAKANGKPSHLTGRMDEFIVFADALSAGEIANLFEDGRPR